jgi:hypothetical protein
MYAEIILGNPRFECDRFGVCKITNEPDYGKFPLPYKRSFAKLSFNSKTQHLTFDFELLSLSKATYKHFFSTNSFLIEDDNEIILSLKTWDLNPTFSLMIPKGKYPILEQNNTLRVVFPTYSTKINNSQKVM